MKIALVLAIILLLSGCTSNQPTPAPLQEQNIPNPTPIESPQTIIPESPQPPQPPVPQNPQPIKESPTYDWEEVGVVISGNYADSDIIELPDGRYRMYYSLEPEVAGFSGQVYSSVSTDGLTWTKENGERMDGSTFPSIIRLPDGRYRMYHQSAGEIKSSLSTDGLTFTTESGSRIDAINTAGLTLDNVASPTVISTGNEYVMVYRGTINQRYAQATPNPNTQLFLWATSTDGLTFTKKGIAVDSRNAILEGLADGPEFVAWDDGSIRLYFWSYQGVYYVTFDGAGFSEPILDYSNAPENSNLMYPPNPPGDPTILKIMGTWYMYYGQHTKGIFAAKKK